MDKLGNNGGRISKSVTTAIVLVFLLLTTSGVYSETKAKPKPTRSRAKKKKTIDTKTAVKKTIASYSIFGTVDQAFKQAGKMGKVFVYIDWDRLKEAGVKKTKRISITGKNHTVEQIITRLVVKSANKGKPLGWLIAENVIIVTSQPRALKLRKRLKKIGTDPVSTKRTNKTRKTISGKVHVYDFEEIGRGCLYF